MALVLPVAALACATDDAASPFDSGEADGVRADAATPTPGEPIDAGGATQPSPADVGGCLPPARVEFSGGQAGWSRNPETGDCCRYDDSVVAPPSWPFFDTEAECQSSCRCSELEDFRAEYASYETERTPLECRCSSETCPSSIAEAELSMCNRDLALPVSRREGCGMVVIADNNGLFGDAWIFEQPQAAPDAGAAGGRLVGALHFGDVPFAPCQAYTWVAGSSFECDDVVTCHLCGDPTSGIPAPPCE